MLSKLSNLNSNLALTLGYLNPALNNSAQVNTLTTKLLCLMFGPNLRYALCYARARIYQNQLSVVVIIDFLVSNFFQVLEARDTLPVNTRNPLLVKIAPDLSEDDKEDIAAVVSRNKVRSQLSPF